MIRYAIEVNGALCGDYPTRLVAAETNAQCFKGRGEVRKVEYTNEWKERNGL